MGIAGGRGRIDEPCPAAVDNIARFRNRGRLDAVEPPLTAAARKNHLPDAWFAVVGGRVSVQAVMAACYVSGVGVSLALHGRLPVIGWMAGALTCLVAAVIARRCGPWLIMLAAAGFALTGLLVGSLRLSSLEESVLASLDGKRVTLVVTVDRAPREHGEKLSFFAETERGEYRGSGQDIEETVLVDLYCREGRDAGDIAGGCSSDVLSVGARLRVTGTLSTPESSPGGDFDYGRYLERRGIHAVLAADTGSFELLGRREGLAGLIDGLGRHARRSLGAGDRGIAGGLYKGMVLGDVSDVPDHVSDDMRDAGLLHLLAVSGQNVVLLGFVMILICRILMLPRPVAVAVAMAVVAVYIPITGADASIMRAGCVGITGLAAILMGLGAARLYLLVLSAAVLLTLNPNSLYDPGFQLSYAAVLGIFCLAPGFASLLRFLPGLMAEAVAVSTAAGLATAPITLVHFQQASQVTVPANVLAAPVAGPVMLLGVLSVIVAPVSSQACRLLNGLAAACAGYLVEVAQLFASLPHAVFVSSSPKLLAIAAYYGMIAVMTILIDRIARLSLLDILERGRKWAAWMVIAAILAAGFACFGAETYSPPDKFTVSFLDVGQGDAVLLQVPGGATVLVDGGPGSVVLERLEESGVRRIDAVVATHAHADHISGLVPVLEKYDVGLFVDSGAPSSSPVYLELLRVVERKGIEYRAVREGDQLVFGELELDVLSPGIELVADDINSNSIVLAASFQEMDSLLAGDAESDVLAALELPVADVFKLSHHGSSDDGLPGLLGRIDPELAVISVGAENEYGHPHDATLSILAGADINTYRTDRDGTVRVSLDGGRMVVTTAG